jgi:hypothetical protein
MRGLKLLLLPIIALTAGVTLGGCSSWDPTDLADFLTPKKPLPGERRAVFPEGVPGVPQGVPAELTKGYQESRPAQASVVAAPDKPEAKPKPKPKPKTASAPPRPAAQPSAQQATPTQKQAKPDSSVWPDPPRTPQSQPQTGWPDPVPSGTFSR